MDLNDVKTLFEHMREYNVLAFTHQFSSGEVVKVVMGNGEVVDARGLVGEVSMDEVDDEVNKIGFSLYSKAGVTDFNNEKI